MKTSTTRVLAGLMAVLAAGSTVHAVNGIAVSTSCFHTGALPSPGSQHTLRGAIVKFTIQGNSVSRCDTIFKYSQGGVGQYPAISYDGTRVAFFRWGVSVVKQGGELRWVQRPGPLPNPNYFPDTNWVSVMNIDGTGLKNLVMVGPPTLEGGEGYAALDWPCGDWIYYEKPTNSGEIWRVHCQNPLLNELVVKFIRRPDLVPDDWDSQHMGDYTLMFRRFSLSADGKLCGAQMIRYVNNTAFCFPPAGGDISTCWPSDHGTGGCNMSISASGHYFGHYLYAGHCNTELNYWDGKPTSSINQQNSSFSGHCGSEMIRWSANSDKWLCQIYSDGTLDGSWNSYANQIVINRMDGTKILTSNNPAGTGMCNDAGDFRIEASGANMDAYEDQNGAWVPISPVVPRDQTAPSAPANLQVQAQGAHAARLTWGASADAESGVFCYIIYRGGTQIGASTALAFSDSGLAENTTYAYTVSAINRGNTESVKASASLTTPADAQGPAIISVDAANGPTFLIVYFDEALDQSTAQTAANYSIPGISVTGASLSADQKKVTLTTSAMTAGTAYTLTIRNVRDKAAAPNASSATASFSYQGLAHGLAYEAYNASCGWSGVPPLTGSPVKSGVARNFDLSNIGSSCVMRFKGFLSVPQAGSYSIIVNASYSANVTLDGSSCITFTSEDFAAPTKMGTRTLSAGKHPIVVDVQSPSSDIWLFCWYEGPDGIRRRISDDMLFYSPGGAVVGADRPQAPAIVPGLFSLSQAAGRLNVRIAAPGSHAMAIVRPTGSVVRNFEGAHPAEYQVPIGQFAPGIYLVKVTFRGKTRTQAFLSR